MPRLSPQGPLVVTGPTRSGTTLLTIVLSAHPDVMVASDPALPLFRAWRNAMVEARGGDRLRAWFDPDGPLQDGYFDPMRTALLDLVLEGSFDLPLEQGVRAAVVEAVQARAAYASPDLVPALGALQGETWGDLLRRLLATVVDVRGAEGRRWIGLKEVWIVDFIPALARLLGDARFIVLLRDPRAVIASMLNQAKDEPESRAHVLSSCRHWRKHVALCHGPFSRMSDQVHLLRYEDFMAAPEAESRRLCAFLGIDYHPVMLDPSAWHDYGTDGRFQGNSSYDSRLPRLETGLVDRWRTRLDPGIQALVEFVCGPEMELVGYRPDLPVEARLHGLTSLEQIVADDAAPSNWRSDLGRPLVDWALELARYTLLAAPATPPSDAARQCFLFEDVLRQCREAIHARTR